MSSIAPARSAPLLSAQEGMTTNASRTTDQVLNDLVHNRIERVNVPIPPSVATQGDYLCHTTQQEFEEMVRKRRSDEFFENRRPLERKILLYALITAVAILIIVGITFLVKHYS